MTVIKGSIITDFPSFNITTAAMVSRTTSCSDPTQAGTSSPIIANLPINVGGDEQVVISRGDHTGGKAGSWS